MTFTGKKTYKVTIYYILASQKQSLVSVNWPGEYTFYNSHARIVECVSEYIFLIEKNTHIHIHTHTQDDEKQKKISFNVVYVQ